jgi:hypothetical protein
LQSRCKAKKGISNGKRLGKFTTNMIDQMRRLEERDFWKFLYYTQEDAIMLLYNALSGVWVVRVQCNRKI